MERLHQANADSALEFMGTAPWHLKFDFKMNGSLGDGTFEEWWADGNYRIVVTSKKYNATEIKNEQGVFRTPGADALPYAVNLLRHAIVHPLPNAVELSAVTPELHTQNSKIGLDCILLVPSGLKGRYTYSANFPNYCLDQGSSILRGVARGVGESLLYERRGIFRKKNVATQVSVFWAGSRAATAEVTKLEGMPVEQNEWADITGLVPSEADPMLLPAETISGSRIAHPDPQYPSVAKAAYVSGTIVLLFTIGKDGHVKSLQTLSSRDGNLEMAARDAVSKWVYKPIQASKDSSKEPSFPIEVQTVVSINFTFSGG